MQHTKIATFGNNAVAREVLRLAVASGLTPSGFPHPTIDEPWVAGVLPHTPDDPHFDVRILWQPNTELIAPRLIAVQLGSYDLPWDRTPDVLACVEDVRAFDALVPAGHPFIPVSQLAMALLRAALEPEISGRLTQDDLIHLGDAMMIQ